MKSVQKLYAYVDESGQDTRGVFFVVGVVVLEEEREAVLHEIERIENESGKKNSKWHKSRPTSRQAYMEGIAQSSFFQKTLFFEEFANSKQYLEMTSYAVAKAIFKRAEENYTASIFIDGFTKREVEKFEKDLRVLRVKKQKVRSVRKEENDGLIRLADALCGSVRDVRDGNPWAAGVLAILKKRGIANQL